MIPRALTDLSREEMLVYLTEIAPPYRVRPIDLIRARREVVFRRWQAASVKSLDLMEQRAKTPMGMSGTPGRRRAQAMRAYAEIAAAADEAQEASDRLWRQLEALSKAFDEALETERGAS